LDSRGAPRLDVSFEKNADGDTLMRAARTSTEADCIIREW